MHRLGLGWAGLGWVGAAQSRTGGPRDGMGGAVGNTNDLPSERPPLGLQWGRAICRQIRSTGAEQTLHRSGDRRAHATSALILAVPAHRSDDAAEVAEAVDLRIVAAARTADSEEVLDRLEVGGLQLEDKFHVIT